MVRKSRWDRLIGQAVVAGALTAGLSGCATRPTYEIHGFSFHTIVEEQNAFVLDYRYGKQGSENAGASANHDRPGHPISQHGQFGPMVRGEELYVKWQDRETGQLFEQRVDLRGKLPANLYNCEVTFRVYGDKIFVYVVTPQPRDPLSAPVGPIRYRNRSVIQVYP